MTLLNDPIFHAHTMRFAHDQDAFFESFKDSFSRLGELGWSGLSPVSYQIPAAQFIEGTSGASEKHLIIHSGLRLTLRTNTDGNVSIALTLDGVVGWMALAVSASGYMVSPQPSHAVVGTKDGVLRRRLVAQVITNVTRTAPIEAVQDLRDSSFAHADGKSTLNFTVSHAWFMRYSESPGSFWLLYAHGPLDGPDAAFGYHGPKRGNVEVTGWGAASTSLHNLASTGGPNLASTAPPPAPDFLARTGTVSPSSDVQLNWTHHIDQTTT